MDRAPMPREVRPAFGPFLEAVRLLFRQETLEVAGLLAMVPPVLWAVRLEWRLRLVPALTLHGIIDVPWSVVVGGLAEALSRVAAVVLLIPVAAGARGLRPRLLHEHLGPHTLAAVLYFGVYAAVTSGLGLLGRWDVLGLGGFETAMRWLAVLDAGFVTWAAWFLWNAGRSRERLPRVRPGLLLWPGVVVALIPGALAVPLSSLWTQLGRLSLLDGPRLLYYALTVFAWTLLLLFAALWMLRVIEAEAAADEPAGV